ncbi:MAG: DUF362 domain-containing protein [Clostridia bacterium]|nr:DUF362 domain-containing protein [Clostridia bacterium]
MRVVKGGTVSKLLEGIKIPAMFYARQDFANDCIAPKDIPGVIECQFARPEIDGRIHPSMNIAITAGSRGIRNIDIITRAIVDCVKSRGAHPFIVPAMGSHGGATAQGQRDILAGYGITEESMGCEVRSSMETIALGLSEQGREVRIDKNAYGADGIIVSCRVKPHTSFRGKYESGICKMMTVGLGKQSGASVVHGEGVGKMAESVPDMARKVLDTGKVLFALPCIENAYDQTCRIEAIPSEEIMDREPDLLAYAKSRMPSILVGKADILVVDWIGKNFSGAGVDPNICGTFSTEYASGGLQVQRTCFLNLSPESHGNALGTGLANAITRKIFDVMDPEMMYANCITSTVLKTAGIPCVLATDKEAIQICLRTCTGHDPDNPKVVRIRNSADIETIMLSEAYYQDVVDGKYAGLTALSNPEPLLFDDEGNVATSV